MADESIEELLEKTLEVISATEPEFEADDPETYILLINQEFNEEKQKEKNPGA
jgi:hypothetical protein